MIRVKISGFIKRNKYKIQNLLTKLIIVAIVVLIATIILSAFRRNEQEENNIKESYIPTETVIKGSNISKEQYSYDINVVNKFLECCNNKNVEEAYNLLSDECKEELYPTIEYFKTNYYDIIFNIERQYNLQSWISTSKYTVYKIRYPNDMMSTGTYNEDNVYQDYITLNKKSDEEKVSIGNLVYAEDCNIVTKTNDFEVTVIKKKIYVSDEEYDIKIKNNTNKRILLDDMQTSGTINIISNSINRYSCHLNNIFLIDLIIEPGQTKEITLKFRKNLSSDNESRTIEFSNIVKDYNAYIIDIKNYTDVTTMKVNLED